METTPRIITVLGGINKLTREYVHPKIASKDDKYMCPDCQKDLVLCQGEIRTWYFRHRNEGL